MHEGHPQNTGQMVGSIQVMLQCPLQPANSGNYGTAMLFVAGMQRARWDARCTLGCVVHAGMRGSRWNAWFTLGCVVCAGMRSARCDARCSGSAHAPPPACWAAFWAARSGWRTAKQY